jgi:hypothetical protein
MIHPTVMADLAAERRADLLRTVQASRRVSTLSHRPDWHGLAGVAGTVSLTVARLRHQARSVEPAAACCA